MKKIVSVIISVTILLTLLIPNTNLFTVSAAALSITKAGGWYETAFVEWTGGSSSSYTVHVKLASAADSAYTQVASQLIRGTRADIPGLKGGTAYDVRVTCGSETARATITPMTHNRTGYAHFNRSAGVGAYNNDGTPKSGVSIIYVTDSNKNSVSHGGQTGIYNILNNASAASNLIVRIIGTVNVPNGVSALSSSGGNNMVRVRGNNLTIEGIGYNANINRWGFTIGSMNSIEIRNLYFYDYPEDAIEVSGANDNKANRIWIHNNTFAKGKNEFAGNGNHDSDKKDGDGGTDVKRAEYITLSYNHYEKTQKTALVGGGQADQQDWITFHHNYFDSGWKRHPMARNAHIHMLNNYFKSISSQAIAAAHNAMIFSEGNTFENCYRSIEARRLNGDDTYGGTAKSWSDSFTNSPRDGKVGIASSRNEKVNQTNSISGGKAYDNFDTDSSKIYTYTAKSASAAKTEVLNYAGRMKNQDYNKGTIHNTPVVIPDLNGTLIKNLKRLDQANYSNWSIQNNLKNGDVIYGDRTNTFTSIPAELAGAEWIKTAADSKELQSNVATFTANGNITAYIGLDSRVVPANLSWLNGWTKTSMTATASNSVTYDIYQRNFASGATVTLGSNGPTASVIMYTVFVKAQSAAQTTTPATTTTAATTTTPPTTMTAATTTTAKSAELLNGILIKNLDTKDTARSEFWSIQNNLKNGDVIYGDRTNTFTSIPADLAGAEWIKLSADSKAFTENVATFTAGADITAYIGLDNRVVPANVPWLNGWTKTALTVTASNDVTYDIYERDFVSGTTVTLGSNGPTASVIMYTVFVKEKSAAQTTADNIATSDNTSTSDSTSILDSTTTANSTTATDKTTTPDSTTTTVNTTTTDITTTLSTMTTSDNTTVSSSETTSSNSTTSSGAATSDNTTTHSTTTVENTTSTPNNTTVSDNVTSSDNTTNTTSIQTATAFNSATATQTATTPSNTTTPNTTIVSDTTTFNSGTVTSENTTTSGSAVSTTENTTITDSTTTANNATTISDSTDNTTTPDDTTVPDSTTTPEITTEPTTTTEPLPDCDCDKADCEVCSENGKWYALGNVDGKDGVTIFDALEILKELVGMESLAKDNPAALITGEAQLSGMPSIFDALEILKYLVSMGSGIDGIHIHGIPTLSK